MSALTRRAAPYAGALLLALGLTALLVAPARAGRTLTISLTANGPQPAVLTAAAGDTIAFRNDDATFVHQVASSSANWSFDSRPLAPGQVYPAGTLTRSGEYDYRGVNLDSFSGKVVVPGGTTPTPPPPPAPSRSASPAPAPSPSASAAPSAPPASPTDPGASPPPLAGSFPGVSPSPLAGGAPSPNVAPVLPGVESAAPPPGGPAVAVARGRLPEPATGRRYGLPAALALVAVLGVGSLLVRLLLAHPAARRPVQPAS